MDSIHELIRAGESESVDFKQTITAIKIARTLVAFANTKGGTILIGVKDNKTIVGVDAEEELFVMEQAAEKYTSPPVAFSYTVYENHNKTILVIEVPESQKKPHFAIDEIGQPHVYMRVKDKNYML